MSQFEVVPMAEKYLDGLMEVEKLSFSSPWSRESFLYEIRENKLARYFVALEDRKVIGYGGLWIVLNEAHITNIAVHPDKRKKGVGRALVNCLLLSAIKNGVQSITLEVRVSNKAAIELYEHYGFQVEGVRKGYYADNGEDALLMWKRM